MALGLRLFGSAGIKVSPLTLGTMRFSEKNLTVASVRSLIAYAHERGVNTHHVSHEYQSFALYREALASFPKSFREGLAIIAKLPYPHFKDGKTDFSLFGKRVDEYLTWLGLEKIAVVQWLFRSEPLDDSIRIPKLRQACAEGLSGCFQDLISRGKVGNIASFPYTSDFWRQSKEIGLVDSQVNYLNLLETEYSEFLDDCYFIALRPLAAGRLGGRSGFIKGDLSDILKEVSDASGIPNRSLTSLALNFPLWHPKVASVVLSMNSREDLDGALAALKPETDIGLFNKVLGLLRSRQPVHDQQGG